MMTQERSTQTNCPISTLYAEDSLAKAFQSLENGEDLKMSEELSSLRLPELPPLEKQFQQVETNICSLRTFPACYRMTKAGRLLPSSVRCDDSLAMQDRGTMSHGKGAVSTS